MTLKYGILPQQPDETVEEFRRRYDREYLARRRQDPEVRERERERKASPEYREREREIPEWGERADAYLADPPVFRALRAAVQPTDEE